MTRCDMYIFLFHFFFYVKPLSAKQMSFAPQRAEYVLNTLQSLQIHEANQLLRGKSTEEVTKNTEYVWSVVYMTYASAGNL